MARFCIGIGLIALLLGVGLLSAGAMDTIQTPIAATLEQAAQASAPEATALLENARAQWQSHWRSTAVLTDHAPMDEIDSLLSQAEAYLRDDRLGDFSALCLRVAQLIRATAEGHKPTWWNFL